MSGTGQALILELRPGTRGRSCSPLLDEEIRRVAGHSITLGGWVSADRTATIAGPSLLWSPHGATAFEAETRPVTVTTTSTFVAWSFDLPTNVSHIQYALQGKQLEQDEQPLLIMLDRAFLIDGTFPIETAPIFDDASATTGNWAGMPFTRSFAQSIRTAGGTATEALAQPSANTRAATATHPNDHRESSTLA